jgi:malate dehydrogenase (oxaloacetate-decarboxylating)(NADP+)
MRDDVREQEVLDYHSSGRNGKLEVVPTKPCLTQRDLSIAYSPGVAHPCLRIQQDPSTAELYTARGNLVAVVTNGTAVLGLGNIGPLAGKPVMEGKAILFKRFADIDVFDLEVDATDVDDFCRVVKALEPTFGGINLEDIRAPECFEIERRLRESMEIPVFHDDQHGTAIIATAGLINAAEIQGKDLAELRVVVSGAGAAGISCTRMFLTVGVRPENVLMLDSHGVLHAGRNAELDPIRREFARETNKRTLAEAMEGADFFCGVSVGNICDEAMVKSMADNPIVFALANPDPEIPYPVARAARDDVIAATGRSDFPNQVNNVLGFPYIFRGALDVRATTVNDEMKTAAAQAIAALAREPVPQAVRRAYHDEQINFGPEYVIPKPLDSRVLQAVSPAVAKAAVDSGVARKQISSWTDYRAGLESRQAQGRTTLHRIFSEARRHQKRIVLTEGEDPRVLHAAEVIADEGLAQPVLIGRPDVMSKRAKELGLDLDGVELVDQADADTRAEQVEALQELRWREGVTPQTAERMLKRAPVLGLMMLRSGQVDGFVGGLGRPYTETLRPALQLIGPAPDVSRVAGCNVAFLPDRTVVFADTTVNAKPSAEELADIAAHACEVARLFSLEPRVAFLSFSNFGDVREAESARPRRAAEIFRERHPETCSDGEMHPDTALNPEHAERFFPRSAIQGDANILIAPDLNSGLITYKCLTELSRADLIGPLLAGLDRPVHVVNYAASTADIVNFAAFTAVAAAQREVEAVER